jgi:hypothetical protein
MMPIVLPAPDSCNDRLSAPQARGPVQARGIVPFSAPPCHEGVMALSLPGYKPLFQWKNRVCR